MKNFALGFMVGLMFAEAAQYAVKKFRQRKQNGLAQVCNSYDPQITHLQAVEVSGEKYQGFPPDINAQQVAAVKNTYCPPCKRDHCEPCQTQILEHNNRYAGIQTASNKWMDMACEEALTSVQHEGGPFGAVILQIDDASGNVIRYWKEHNHVPEWTDPTAHAEVCTIRAAAQQLGVLDLGKIHKNESKLSQPSETSHCVIYSSAEPCPMCLSAIYWANIKELIFAATIFDAAAPGVNFSDKMIYDELALPLAKRKHMQVRHANSSIALDAFNYYKRSPIKTYGSAQ